MKVTVNVPREEGLVPGMYVEVELVTETHADALLVPKRAVIYEDERALLFRLQDGETAGEQTVERLAMVPLIENETAIEPAHGSGLVEGDRIVVAGQAGLKDGSRVRLAGDRSTPEKKAP